jgi:hypothetical protein
MEYSYYGRMGPRAPDTFGVHFMDDLFKRILDKHEQKLLSDQNKLLESFRKRMHDELEDLNKTVKKISMEIYHIRYNIDEIKTKGKKKMELIKV